ncbi:MAG: bacteriochlorophyll 4-vinyl reductase [Chromatiaceae bacterium]|nr:MAG: bacteriochlorophyll 4-vinyl reductase [Chromatiaceae bacterium]
MNHPEPLPDTGVARIGPNAIIRVAEALQASDGPAAEVFAAAGLSHYLTQPPAAMVLETEVIALQQALRATLDRAAASAVNLDAGRRTGDYLLAVRIPKAAQRVLRLLPPRPAARLLLKAVGQHAWTFAGSGRFDCEAGQPLRVTIADCPTCRGASAGFPVCDFYCGAFERLFQTLVSPRARVQEVACGAMGAAACVFEITW